MRVPGSTGRRVPPLAGDPPPLPKPTDPVCSDPHKTNLYKPYAYKPFCMTPPITPDIESCPIDERETLQNGVTRAIPYP